MVACIPEPLLRSKCISSGAKLCWGQLARHAGEGGRCFPRQAVLATSMAVCERQVRRYLRELVHAGLIRVVRRGLNLPNTYEFLWHEIFQDSKSLIQQDRTSLSDQNRTSMSVHDRTPSAGPSKEEESPLRESVEQTIDRSSPSPRRRHRHNAIREWPPADIDAIRRTLELYAYSDGSPVQPTDELIERLLITAKFYMRTAFEVAALLDRKYREVSRVPRWWPEKPEWFVRIVDNAYADEWVAERRPPAQARAATVDAQVAAAAPDPADLAERQDLIRRLAAKKAMR
jgi:hypothetical protein